MEPLTPGYRFGTEKTARLAVHSRRAGSELAGERERESTREERMLNLNAVQLASKGRAKMDPGSHRDEVASRKQTHTDTASTGSGSMCPKYILAS